jgi:hypothetical protein
MNNKKLLKRFYSELQDCFTKEEIEERKQDFDIEFKKATELFFKTIDFKNNKDKLWYEVQVLLTMLFDEQVENIKKPNLSSTAYQINCGYLVRTFLIREIIHKKWKKERSKLKND